MFTAKVGQQNTKLSNVATTPVWNIPEGEVQTGDSIVIGHERVVHEGLSHSQARTW